MKHLHTQALWVQETERLRRLKYAKVRGDHNPANKLTKYVCRLLINRHSGFIRAVFVTGRASSAPTLDMVDWSVSKSKAYVPQQLLASVVEDKDGKVDLDLRSRLGILRAAAEVGKGDVNTQGSTYACETAESQGEILRNRVDCGAKVREKFESDKDVVNVKDAKAKGEINGELHNLDGGEQSGMVSDLVCSACVQMRWADMDEDVTCGRCKIS